MRHRTVFACACLAGMVAGLGFFALRAWLGHRPPRLYSVGDGLYVSAQLAPEDLQRLRRGGIHGLIDLRPDGEDAGQTPSAEMRQAAETRGMAFAYVPVQHGEIQPAWVDGLAAEIIRVGRPAVLYCRSGNRAVRTLALVEASRPQGRSEAELLEMARSTGHPIDDLRDAIRQRIAARAAPAIKP